MSQRFNPNVWLFMGNTFFVQTGLGIFALIFNLYLASMGLREDYIGLFSFANTAALGAFAIPAGFLSNRFGPRRCLLVASILMGACAAGASAITVPALIVADGVLLGASTALVFVPGGPFLMDNCDDDNRLQAFSTNFAVISVASVLGSLISGYLPALLSAAGLGEAQTTRAYQLTLLVGGIFCALGAAPMLFAQATKRRQIVGRPSVPAVKPLNEVAARRVLVAMAAAVVITSVATGLVLPFYNVYLEERLGASVEQIGVIYAAGSLLMVPCSLAGPALSRRLGTVLAVAVPRLLTAPFMFSLALAASPGLGALVYVARAGLMSVTWPLDNAFVMELMPPRMRAMQAGVRSASWNIGWSVASLVAGQMIVVLGYPIAFALSALLHLVGAGYFFVVFRRYEARRAALAPEVA